MNYIVATIAGLLGVSKSGFNPFSQVNELHVTDVARRLNLTHVF